MRLFSKLGLIALFAVFVSLITFQADEQKEIVYMSEISGPLPTFAEYRKPELDPAGGKVKKFLDIFE